MWLWIVLVFDTLHPAVPVLSCLKKPYQISFASSHIIKQGRPFGLVNLVAKSRMGFHQQLSIGAEPQRVLASKTFQIPHSASICILGLGSSTRFCTFFGIAQEEIMFLLKRLPFPANLLCWAHGRTLLLRPWLFQWGLKG